MHITTSHTLSLYACHLGCILTKSGAALKATMAVRQQGRLAYLTKLDPLCDVESRRSLCRVDVRMLTGSCSMAWTMDEQKVGMGSTAEVVIGRFNWTMGGSD